MRFFHLAKFVIVRSSTINPRQYSVVVLKGQGFQDKRKIKILKFNTRHKTPQDMLNKATNNK